MAAQKTTNIQTNINIILERWRSKALTVTLIVTLITGMAALVSSIAAALSDLFFFSTMCLAYFLMLVILVFRRMKYIIRAWIFLGAGLVMAILNFTMTGASGSGKVYLIAIAIYAFILVGERAGWIVTSLSLFVFLTFGILYFTGFLVPKGVFEPYSTSFWLASGATFTMLTIIGVVLLQRYSRLLLDTLKAEQDVSAQLRQAYDSTLEGWARALELRDQETENHCQRVTDLSLKIGRVLGLTDKELENVYRGALMHDIGKMGIPDNILLKPDRLVEEEWQIMRQHPAFAQDMLSPINYLKPSIVIPYYHHEKWDGKGYPEGLKGDKIPLLARIFTVADVWDALTSDRPYRKAWTKEQALAYIHEKSGTDFDPGVVKAFNKALLEQN